MLATAAASGLASVDGVVGEGPAGLARRGVGLDLDAGRVHEPAAVVAHLLRRQTRLEG